MLVYQRVHVTKNHGGKVGNVIYTNDNFTSKFRHVNMQYVHTHIYIYIHYMFQLFGNKQTYHPGNAYGSILNMTLNMIHIMWIYHQLSWS